MSNRMVKLTFESGRSASVEAQGGPVDRLLVSILAKGLSPEGSIIKEEHFQTCEDCGRWEPVPEGWDGSPMWCLDCYNAQLEG